MYLYALYDTSSIFTRIQPEQKQIFLQIQIIMRSEIKSITFGVNGAFATNYYTERSINTIKEIEFHYPFCT